MENNHDIDKKFNEASQSVEETEAFPDFDKVWAKVEAKLDTKENKKKGIPVWLPYGIAASLVISLGVFYFMNNKNVLDDSKPQIVKNMVSKQQNANIQAIDSTMRLNIEKEISAQKNTTDKEILAYEKVKIPGFSEIKSKINDPFFKKSTNNIPVLPSVEKTSWSDTLKEKDIEEVVTLGYSKTSTRSKNISSSSIVNRNLIASNSSSGVLNSLKGSTPGVSVTSASGTPGASKIVIRGVSSVSADSQPLYVIDGEIADSKKFGNLKTTAIKSVSVIKDAAATAIYGSKAANGVIVISTTNASKSTKKKLEKLMKTLAPKSKPDILSVEVELPKAGLLTAGEINDFSKWNYWNDIAVPNLERYKNEWKFSPERRVSVQLVNKNKKPVVGEKLKLLNVKNEIVWEAVSDNLGNAELWINPLIGADSASEKYILTDDSGKILSHAVKEFKNGQNLIILDNACVEKRNLDLAFVVDATGSMGDEISYLQSELLDVLKKVESKLKDTDIRYGSVFYRDQGDEYITRKFEFSNNPRELVDFIRKQNAGGGGDYPEAVVEAMQVSVDDLKWSTENSTKIMFLILDAPPHQSEENINTLFEKIKTAARKGITIIPLAASDIDKQTEYLMRTFSLMTNGTYTFLTNDSGIGHDHIKPTIDSYEVEKLNDLLLRLILQRATLPQCNNGISNNYINKKLETEIKGNTKSQIKIFPNPTKGLINITSQNPLEELYIYDLAGKIIMKKEKLSGKNTLNITAYPQSLYLMRIKTESGWETFKIIKN